MTSVFRFGIRRGRRVDPLIFRLLHYHRCVGKKSDVPDVVTVRMRHKNVVDIGGLQPDRRQLRRYRPVKVIDNETGKSGPAFRIADRRLGHASVPHQIVRSDAE